MIEHAFTKKNIQRSIAYKDMINDIQFRDVEYRHNVATSAYKKIQENTIFSKALKEIKILGKNTYQFHDVEQELVSRLISKNIRTNYSLKQLNRQTIINNTVSILKESSPFNIFRFDIIKFFESIDRKKIVSNLLIDGRCSRQTIILLSELFKSFEAQNIEGLPRGLGISSILAEYVLHSFDRALREADSVFFYARFVDDIVIITSNLFTQENIKNLVEKNIPNPLKMHTKGEKVSSHAIPKTSLKKSEPKIFNYLGYKFTIHPNLHSTELVLGNKRRRIVVQISDEKITKLKGRLIDSFVKYITVDHSLKEYQILKNRLMALTGNYYISDPLTGINIKTGIFFNYSEKNEFIKCELGELDRFLRGLLYCKKHLLSRRISGKIGKFQKRELSSFSFLDGFHKKRFYSFSHLELCEIKGGWTK